MNTGPYRHSRLPMKLSEVGSHAWTRIQRDPRILPADSHTCFRRAPLPASPGECPSQSILAICPIWKSRGARRKKESYSSLQQSEEQLRPRTGHSCALYPSLISLLSEASFKTPT